MYRIHIWKCKPAWQAKSTPERNAFVKRFAATVRHNLEDHMRREGGPYFIQKPTNCLLVWTWSDGKDAALQESIRMMDLDSYFERLADLEEKPGVSARTVALRLG